VTKGERDDEEVGAAAELDREMRPLLRRLN